MSLLDFVFPRHCVGCGKKGQYFCAECTRTIKRVKQICPVCERPTPFGQTHDYCRTKNSLDGLVSLFAYEGIIREAIHKLKYKFVTDLEEEFWKIIQSDLEKRGEEMIALNKFVEEDKPVIVPVPLHRLKENWRGFNQSSLFGKRLANHFNLSFSDKLIVRTKNVLSQTKFTQKEREENVKGIFSISPKVRRPLSLNIHNSLFNILLVDDVWTTGATLKEAGKTLKLAGTKKVWGFTIAR
ncbi:MAG: ComF family protein [Microgenomates group bacterium]